VGESAAPHVAERSKWIHRRVEQITFPLPSDRVYRRDISIDFTIPEVDPVGTQSNALYYAPLSLLERWPPLLRLDIRNPEGKPLPLLTSDQNARADAALLRAVAAEVLKRSGLSLTAELEEMLDRLAGLRRSLRQQPARERILTGTLLSLIPPDSLGNRPAEMEALAADNLFVELAGAMPRTTVLWLGVKGTPGERQVVKLSYDAPFRTRIPRWSARAFGLEPLVLDFQAPHLGGSGSYHLAVSVPPPLHITDSAVLLFRPQTAEGSPQTLRPVAGCTGAQETVDFASPEGALTLYAHHEARDARFYVSGPRTGGLGKVRIATVVARSGLIRPGAMAGLGITALLAAVTLRLGPSLQYREAVVTTLLVAPALLAYLVVRPADHVVAGQYVRGLRRVLMGLGALPLVAAVSLSISGGWSCALKLGFILLTLMAAALSGTLVLAWIRAGDDVMSPFSKSSSSGAVGSASSAG
jgi:hypothetical protein